MPKKKVEPKISFWSTAPGIITAVAGLISAIAGLIAIFDATGILATPTPTANVPTIEATETQLVSPPISTPFIGPDDHVDKGVPMVFVPAGKFTRGGNNDNDEKPVHEVNLDAFYIDKYEVTNSFYKACVDSGRCQLPKDASKYNDPNFANHPVVYLPWSMAKTYCEWRGARLPTEAEWEKAARGTDGRTYPWGEVLDETFANYNDKIDNTTAVGSYESGKSPYGAYDMAGNVYEWVSDWYLDNYYLMVGDNASNPLGPALPPYDLSDSNYGRVLRGGSWSTNDGSHLRSAYRTWDHPETFYGTYGFRCARSESSAAMGTPTLEMRELPANLTDPKGVQMALVPAGEFRMGSTNGDPDEVPVHNVYLDAFYMDVYEVTNAFYKACVDANRCKPPYNVSSNTHTNYYGNSQYDDYPVTYVDWDMAKTYCEWREARLPTEAEWEKAARGTDERTYPWGEGVDETLANYNKKVNDTTPVGSYEKGKSPYGIYDMAGNVWEWVSDWYLKTYYLGSPASNPQGPSRSDQRIVRGPGWDTTTIRAADRAFFDSFGMKVGIRCARDASP